MNWRINKVMSTNQADLVIKCLIQSTASDPVYRSQPPELRIAPT